MNKEQLATLLNGREYRKEITPDEARQAKEAGLVVVYGASDDCAEFEGAITDEIDCYDGGSVLVDKEGFIPGRDQIDLDDDDALQTWLNRRKGGKEILILWAEDEYDWQYSTDIPHATFDIMEEGQKYCKGIVFSINDL